MASSNVTVMVDADWPLAETLDGLAEMVERGDQGGATFVKRTVVVDERLTLSVLSVAE